MKHFILTGILFTLPLYVYSKPSFNPDAQPIVPSGWYKDRRLNTGAAAKIIQEQMNRDCNNCLARVYDVSIKKKWFFDDSIDDFMYKEIPSPLIKRSERFRITFSYRGANDYWEPKERIEKNIVECDVRAFSELHPTGQRILLVNCKNDGTVKLDHHTVQIYPHDIYFRYHSNERIKLSVLAGHISRNVRSLLGQGLDACWRYYLPVNGPPEDNRYVGFNIKYSNGKIEKDVRCDIVAVDTPLHQLNGILLEDCGNDNISIELTDNFIPADEIYYKQYRYWWEFHPNEGFIEH